MTWASKYLNGVETSLDRPQRYEEDEYNEVDRRSDIFKNIGHALDFERVVAFSSNELEDMRRYLLFNCGVIDSYLE